MAAVESYSPCPCGSGQKFKWCCQKVESYADKAQRLFDTGQVDAAIKILDDGLLKEPGNPWLSTRKAVMQVRNDRPEDAKITLRLALMRNPKHFGSLVLLTRCVLETENPINGAGMFQRVLAVAEAQHRASVGSLAKIVSYLFIEDRRIPAALKHLELAQSLGDPDGTAAVTIQNVESAPAISPWLKDTYDLAPTPSHWTGEGRDRFEQALSLARQGFWAAAAAEFDLVSGGEPGGEADHNLGLCRLWLGDEDGAVVPLRRRVRHLGATTAAVDLEVLCQQIAPVEPDDRVEQVRLTWPLRNRQALHDALVAAADVVFDGAVSDDPKDPESPLIDQFVFLDRPESELSPGAALDPDTIPRILGRVGLTDEIAFLETFDDGRVDLLGDRFTILAGSSIVAAHPRTTVIAVLSRSALALTWEWMYPVNSDPTETERVERQERLRLLRDVWPVTPMAYLGFRTPERAARDGDAEVPLRATLCQLEYDHSVSENKESLPLRGRLGIKPEPTLDPNQTDIAKVPLGRLHSLVLEDLDDDRLIMLYRRVRRSPSRQILETASLALVGRPHLFQSGKIEPIAVYTDLASFAVANLDGDGMRHWMAAGRQADRSAHKTHNEPIWDIIEVRYQARMDPPEVWVPQLAIVLERYSRDSSANQVILSNLVEMGLVDMAPNPDNPNDILLDSRPLQMILAQFGPRVTTASGRLGVSATKPELWTPGGAATGSGGDGFWTPGSGAASPGTAPPGDKPKLILPGR